MYFRRPHDDNLGFDWGGLVTSIVSVGGSYAVAKQTAKSNLEQVKLQVAAQERQNQQLALAAAAAKASQAALPVIPQSMLPPATQLQQTATGQWVAVPTQPAGSQWPSWAIPAAIAGGGVVLALLIGTRQQPRAA